MLEEIGKLIEYYRKKEQKYGNRKYFKKHFILDEYGEQICDMKTYNKIANGNIINRIDCYNKLSIKINRDFHLYTDFDNEFYPILINNICRAIEIRDLKDINMHFDNIKCLFKDRHYIWYEELYQSIIFIESIIYGTTIDDNVDIEKIDALAYSTTNRNLKHILLYFMFFYYTVYTHELMKRNKILDNLKENDRFDQNNSYYKYIYLLRVDIIEKNTNLAMSMSEKWYQNETLIYSKYLSIKVFEYIIHGRSTQAIDLIDEAHKLIKNNPNYFTNVESAIMYHQRASHLYYVGYRDSCIYEIQKAIQINNVPSHNSIFLLFIILANSDCDEYKRFQFILKNLRFKKSSGVRLLVRCFNYIYIEKNYKRAEVLILNELFDWFIIDISYEFLSKQFMKLLKYCVDHTKDYHLLGEYIAKENKVFYKKNKRKRERHETNT